MWIKEIYFPVALPELFKGLEFEVTEDWGVVSKLEADPKCLKVYPQANNSSVDELPRVDSDILVMTHKYFITEGEMTEKFPDLPQHFPTTIYRSIQDTIDDFTSTCTNVILDKVENFFFDNNVSIHAIHLRKPEVMRYHDTPFTAYRWSADKYIYQMIDESPATPTSFSSHQRFFLCSDCQPTINRFKKRYGDRIQTTPKTARPIEWDRSENSRQHFDIKCSPEAIIEAFVDNFVLGSCFDIIRNFPSTFSLFAMTHGNLKARNNP